MRSTPFVVPDPNDPDSLDAHRRQVFDAYAPLFDLIDSALRIAVPQATDVFGLLGGPVDLAVHATLTRYVARQSLAGRAISVEDEEMTGYELDRVANCGLCIRSGACEARVLKAAVGGIPKSSSDARSRFYSSNQAVLRFGDGERELQVEATPISLVLLWSIDESFAYQGLEIACPRAERRDKSVDCYWIAAWDTRQSISPSLPPGSEGAESDLDDIRALDDGREAEGS
jgi:hypothetical protein